MDLASIQGVKVIECPIYNDERGSFVEVWKNNWLEKPIFEQSNISKSRKNTVRGLHFHLLQWDLWRVDRGAAFVVLADLRRLPNIRVATDLLQPRESGRGAKKRLLLIPPGVAHGFLAIQKTTLCYFVSEKYDSKDEYGVYWNDPTLGIEWPVKNPILSDRDHEAQTVNKLSDSIVEKLLALEIPEQPICNSE